MDGMLRDGTPGKILRLWKELREFTGIVEAKKKDGVKFKVRSAEDLIDKIREKANQLGILIYPANGSGNGFPVEDGTLATVSLQVVAQAIEDGSTLVFYGFGLGADSQDKAGGKAGTYAFKQALIQALLAGGKENAKKLGVADTDDTDTPIEGGVKVKKKDSPLTVEAAKDLVAEADTQEAYDAAIKKVMAMRPENQLKVRDALVAAKARIAAVGPDRSKDSER